jgi:hypothetical protein
MSQTILIPGYLYWDGTKYILTPGTAGTVFTANGDLSGSPNTQKVIGLQTIPISSTHPTNGQVLTYNGTAWAPAAASGSFTASQDLSGTSTVQRVVGIQTIPVLSTAPTSGQVLTYNGTAWAPATSSGGGSVTPHWTGVSVNTNLIPAATASAVYLLFNPSDIPSSTPLVVTTASALGVTPPNDGDVIVARQGPSGIHSVTIAMPSDASTTIENPSFPGNYLTSVTWTLPSQVGLRWKFSSALGAWELYGGSANVGAVAAAPYLQIGSLDGNANARILTAGSNITIADGGPGNNLTISSAGGGGGSSIEPIFSRSLALHIGGLRSIGGLSESTTPSVGDVFTAAIGSEPVRIIYDPTVVGSFGPSLWIARFGASDVVRFDIGSGYVDVIPFDDISTGADIFDMTFGVSSGINYLWAIDQSAGKLLVKISSVPQVGILASVVIPESLSGVVFDTVNVHVVVAAGNNHLYTVDPTSLVVSSAHTIGVSGDSFFIAYPGNVFNETERVLLYAQGFLWISVFNAGTNTGKMLQIDPGTFATVNTYTPSGTGNNITFYSPVSDSAGAGFIFFIGTNNSTLASSVYRINVSTSTITATLAVPSGNLASAATIGLGNTLWMLSQSAGTNVAIQVTGLTTTPAIGITQTLYGTDPLLTDIVFDSNLSVMYVTDSNLDQMYRFPIAGTPVANVNITPLIGVGEWQPPSIYVGTPVTAIPAPPLASAFTVVGQMGLVQSGSNILATSANAGATNEALTPLPAGVSSGGPWVATIVANVQIDTASNYPGFGIIVSNGVVSGTSLSLLCGFYMGPTLKVPSLSANTELLHSQGTGAGYFADNTSNAGWSPYYLRILCDGVSFLFQCSKTNGYNWRTFASVAISTAALGTINHYGFMLGCNNGVGNGAAVVYGLNMVSISQLTVTGVTSVGGALASVTTSTPHDMATGASVTIEGVVVSGSNYNGIYESTVIVTGANTFTVPSVSTGTYVSGGLVTVTSV